MVLPIIFTLLSSFCETHLIGDDPYQFENLSTDQLVYVYWLNKNQDFKSNVLINEMRSRLDNYLLPPEDFEIITKTLENEPRGETWQRSSHVTGKPLND